jgi:uncharacterized protein YecE (DUF72 family)
MSITSYVGVSGFSYASWKGGFYPGELKNEEFLPYYSSRLNSVEINSSFYAAPSAGTVKGWGDKTQENFRFAFKAPKQITHVLKLGEGSAEAAERLWDLLGQMGDRRGPILFQLPPYAKQDLKLLERFLSGTASVQSRVFEFRHDSWLQQPTFCIAETEDMAPVLRVCGGVAYFRLRKESYNAGEIDEWAGKIRKTARGSSECYVYLRHDETGENALLAQRLAKTLQS